MESPAAARQQSPDLALDIRLTGLPVDHPEALELVHVVCYVA
jgi:hypothetical protein